MRKLAVGIMSGTSLDGIDVVIAEIEGSFLTTKLEVIAFETFDYDKKLLERIKKGISLDESNSELLCSLNFELGYAYAEVVKKICKNNDIDLESIDFISSHGQTIYHITDEENGNIKSSLQLGEGSIIANLCNTTVVSNFRSADIAVGGQGAPLVPYADFVLFKDNEKTRVMNNIGGISNVTVLPKNGSINNVIAFDTGPGNMMIDYACKKLFNVKYDDLGKIARKGKVIQEMLDELLLNKFFSLKPPKSTGREDFGDKYTDKIRNKFDYLSNEDIVCTLTHFTAISIADAYKKFILNDLEVDEVIISGGGVYNDFLLELIEENLQGTKILKLEDIGYDSSIKEALAFVVLGNETLNMNYSNVKSATGARKNVILGQVNYVLKD